MLCCQSVVKKLEKEHKENKTEAACGCDEVCSNWAFQQEKFEVLKQTCQKKVSCKLDSRLCHQVTSVQLADVKICFVAAQTQSGHRLMVRQICSFSQRKSQRIVFFVFGGYSFRSSKPRNCKVAAVLSFKAKVAAPKCESIG